MTEKVLLSKEKLEEIKAEYDRHISQTRHEIAERIKEAREFGDLSENAEYDAAKLEQAELEERIYKLETMMRNAHIIDEEDDVSGKVNVGNLVHLKEQNSKEVFQYKIVGSAEADPISGRISNESPLGAAIIGKSEGDKVEVEVPAGKIVYTIEKVEKGDKR